MSNVCEAEYLAGDQPSGSQFKLTCSEFQFENETKLIVSPACNDIKAVVFQGPLQVKEALIITHSIYCKNILHVILLKTRLGKENRGPHTENLALSQV